MKKIALKVQFNACAYMKRYNLLVTWRFKSESLASLWLFQMRLHERSTICCYSLHVCTNMVIIDIT